MEGQAEQSRSYAVDSATSSAARPGLREADLPVRGVNHATASAGIRPDTRGTAYSISKTTRRGVVKHGVPRRCRPPGRARATPGSSGGSLGTRFAPRSAERRVGEQLVVPTARTAHGAGLGDVGVEPGVALGPHRSVWEPVPRSGGSRPVSSNDPKRLGPRHRRSCASSRNSGSTSNVTVVRIPSAPSPIRPSSKTSAFSDGTRPAPPRPVTSWGRPAGRPVRRPPPVPRAGHATTGQGLLGDVAHVVQGTDRAAQARR